MLDGRVLKCVDAESGWGTSVSKNGWMVAKVEELGCFDDYGFFAVFHIVLKSTIGFSWTQVGSAFLPSLCPVPASIAALR